MIFNLYIFNRTGVCLYYCEWHRKRNCESQTEEQKLVFGLIYSLRIFASKVSPEPCETFNFYKTSGYKLHYFETPTGLKFALLTDPNSPDMREQLRILYSIYVRYISNNPIAKLNEPINCNQFAENLNKVIQSLGNF
eukprot:TRINITY_DN2251_c0_g1_i1.p1 TRINITY_DN2251_c0_g1~~TRINITY_DN2251_c0_g1_i1.p1  ORF type:complete len:137 (+),score=35.16 TRINITY_DN2251_c0_g1_i1:117-527(+)